MLTVRRLTLAHLWVAFATFAVAIVLGVWQMWARSPLPAPWSGPANYYLSVTAHGVSMAYVLTTFFIMGFGYFVAETALERPLPAKTWAWAGFWMGIAGVVMAVASILSGRASVLYTFYPPMTATPWFYIGLVLVVAASWIWCVLMILAMAEWKRENAGKPVPLAMYATVANAVMWLWTTVGVTAELLFQVIPAAFGWTQLIDVGLTRTLFSWTLHPIVYFWLLPAYVAFYTLAPRAAGGRLYSDTLGRLSFILFLLYSLPVGLHHLFMDPEHSTGFKFLQMALTVLVTVPTLLTIFTVPASLEVAGRARGGRGPVRLDWRLAVGSADGAGDGSGVFHAVVRRLWRRDQYEPGYERHGPQYVVGHGALSSDLWRHGGDHVFRHRLRDLADVAGPGVRVRPAAQFTAVVVGDRDDGDDHSLAFFRTTGPMAPGGELQLRRSEDRPLGPVGDSLPGRRSDIDGQRGPFHRQSRILASGNGRDGSAALPLRGRGSSPDARTRRP